MAEFLEVLLSVLFTVPFLAVVFLAIRRLRRRFAAAPGQSPPRLSGGEAGDREPRRPKPFAGAGAVAAPRARAARQGRLATR